MILTELGLHFRKHGDRWRCVEHPELVMLRGGGYEVDGQGFNSLDGAVRQAIQRVQAQDIPEAEQRARIALIEVQCRAARAGAAPVGHLALSEADDGGICRQV